VLSEWIQCRRAYLCLNAATVCVDAEAIFLCVLFVVSYPRFLGGRINVGGWALSPWWSEEAWDLFLSFEALGSPFYHVAVNPLPGAGVSDAGIVCNCRLHCVSHGWVQGSQI
jgi:hypothetical protein